MRGGGHPSRGRSTWLQHTGGARGREYRKGSQTSPGSRLGPDIVKSSILGNRFRFDFTNFILAAVEKMDW